MREMVVPEHKLRVDRLIRNEERNMGIVPANLDEAFASADASEAPKGDFSPLPEGNYQGVVTSAVVSDESRRPWVDAELQLKIQVDEGDQSGKFAFCDIELAPNTDKEGKPSPGKLGFVKGQLAALGYTGKLSEVEYAVQSFVGARIEFRQKVTLSEKTNPHTGSPYENREVYVNELLQAGLAAAPVTSSEPVVY